MYRDRLSEGLDSKHGALRHVGSRLDLNRATLRYWVKHAERGDRVRSVAAVSLVTVQHVAEAGGVSAAVRPVLLAIVPPVLTGLACGLGVDAAVHRRRPARVVRALRSGPAQ